MLVLFIHFSDRLSHLQKAGKASRQFRTELQHVFGGLRFWVSGLEFSSGIGFSFRDSVLCAPSSAKSVFLAVRPDAPAGEAKDHGLAMAPAHLAAREQGRRQAQLSSSSVVCFVLGVCGSWGFGFREG